jgi:hypothetical protein
LKMVGFFSKENPKARFEDFLKKDKALHGGSVFEQHPQTLDQRS